MKHAREQSGGSRPSASRPTHAACNGDIEKALDPYEWNTTLAQVVMREVCHFSGSISPTAPA
jgi:hypothetical protein